MVLSPLDTNNQVGSDFSHTAGNTSTTVNASDNYLCIGAIAADNFDNQTNTQRYAYTLQWNFAGAVPGYGRMNTYHRNDQGSTGSYASGGSMAAIQNISSGTGVTLQTVRTTDSSAPTTVTTPRAATVSMLNIH